jgi:hypothetical protein
LFRTELAGERERERGEMGVVVYRKEGTRQPGNEK